MSFLDKLKGTFGKAKDKSDAIVDENRERIPDNVEKRVRQGLRRRREGRPRRDDTPAADTPDSH